MSQWRCRWSGSTVVSPTREFIVFLGTFIPERNHPAVEGPSASTNDVSEVSGFIEALKIILKRDIVPLGARVKILF